MPEAAVVLRRYDDETLAAAGGLDLGDVDLLHAHHGLERALGLGAAGGHGFHENARRDLPGDAPLVLAPAAGALLAAVADDGVPIAVGLCLVPVEIRNEKASVCLNAGPPLRPRQGTPATVNSTINTSPFLPEGKSLGA
jgi:hypothetical protein